MSRRTFGGLEGGSQSPMLQIFFRHPFVSDADDY